MVLESIVDEDTGSCCVLGFSPGPKVLIEVDVASSGEWKFTFPLIISLKPLSLRFLPMSLGKESDILL